LEIDAQADCRLWIALEINSPFNDATHQLAQFDRNYPGGRLIVQSQEVPQISASWRAQVGNTPFVTASQVGLPNSLRYTYYGNVIHTRRNRFVNTFLYELPFGTGKQFLGTAKTPLNLLVGGWDVTGITILQTGPFLTPTIPSSHDPSGTDPSERSDGNYQRPDCVAGQNPNTRSTAGRYLNAKAFSIPGLNTTTGVGVPIGRFGNCSVGILNGPGTKGLSMSAGKDFVFHDRFALRYEADYSNILYIENLRNPQTQLGASFGTISSVQSIDQAGPRTVQTTLRLKF
jgi:hypothetical protein